MPEDKIRVSARIPKTIHDICLQRYDNITIAINTGLELLCSQSEDKTKTKEDEYQQNEDICQTDEDIRRQHEDVNIRAEVQEIKARLEEKCLQLEDKDKHIETLKDELNKAERDKESLREQLKSNDDNQLLRITDLKEEITVLRRQLDTKDDTIKNLTTITESQFKGYKLIEAPGAKKPWWRFW